MSKKSEKLNIMVDDISDEGEETRDTTANDNK